MCLACERLSVCVWFVAYDDTRGMSATYKLGPREGEETLWIPLEGFQTDFPDVPEEIAKAATEAWRCHSAGSHRGAVMLARALVEATAKAKGIASGSLADKIDELAKNGLIRAAVADQAHEIRHLGNSTAHGDLGDPVSKEDADEVLNLMGEVLNEVFQSPARSDRLAAARKARATTP